MPATRNIALAALALALTPAGAQAAVPAPRAPASQLDRVDSVRANGVRYTRLRQEVGGVPVLGREAVVTDAPGSRGDLLIDRTRALRPGAPALVGRGRAQRAAVRSLGARTLRRPARGTAAALPRDGVARRVWRVTVAVQAPVATWEVLVDARSGRILRTRNLLREAANEGTVFDTNPIVGKGSTAGLPTTGDADDPDFVYKAVPLPRLSSATTCLEGAYATVQQGLLPADVCAPSHDFTALRRNNPGFEAVMAYFHIDRTQAYIRSLGFNNVQAGAQETVANAYTDDNASYDPATDLIELGTGGTDDGEDGEVIVHEYGHAVQDDQVPGFGESADSLAMGEGFGDYLSATIASTYVSNPTFNACLGEWDEYPFEPSANPPCLRRLDDPRTLAQLRASEDCADDEHCVGQVWSSLLWTLRARLGPAVFDRILIQSQFGITASASFTEATRALLAADQALNGARNRSQIVAAAGSRGLIDGQRLDDTPGEAVALSVPGTVAGSISVTADPHDVFRVRLTAGRPVRFRLSGSAPDADLRLLAPAAPSVDSAPLAAAETTGSNETMRFTPTQTGDYFVDVRAIAGAGPYTLRAESDDADGDGVADQVDNCPRRSNARQRDWDRDDAGDVCDRSARVTIKRIARSGTRLRISATVQPVHLGARPVRLAVRRLQTVRGRTRFRAIRQPRMRRRASSGRVTLRLRLRPGRYRVRAVLRASGYRRVQTRQKAFSVRR